MKTPKAFFESEKVEKYLLERGLMKQYKKSKNYILPGFAGGTEFGQMQPKSDNIRYFRINKQYRAIATF
ncbi:MAG TPA: hypothetical protein PKD96_00760 [Candidatus Absconditabacterales bacterium]|nr:hypothetical protein [Candidatus Absconditabacterales bacterium]HMT26811.1 hypothetical protein [Candidatus Absconditabacterales bacterium]